MGKSLALAMVLFFSFSIYGHATTTKIAGITYTFGLFPKTVPNVKLCILEPPNKKCTYSDQNGRYAFPIKLKEFGNTHISIETYQNGFKTARSATLELNKNNYLSQDTMIIRNTMNIQMVENTLYGLYNSISNMALPQKINNSKCNIVVTVANKTKFDRWAIGQDGEPIVNINPFLKDNVHGFIGALVTLSRIDEGVERIVSSHGPVYFNNFVTPDQGWKHTSEDGGLIMYNLEEGVYRIRVYDTAKYHSGKPFNFNNVAVDCRNWGTTNSKGVFVNVGPAHIHPDDYLSEELEEKNNLWD